MINPKTVQAVLVFLLIMAGLFLLTLLAGGFGFVTEEIEDSLVKLTPGGALVLFERSTQPTGVLPGTSFELSTVETTGTSTPGSSPSLAPSSRSTTYPNEPVISATPVLLPTHPDGANEKAMLDLIYQLQDKGLLHSMNGSFFQIGDYLGHWSQATSIQKTYPGYAPANFVLQAALTWQAEKLELAQNSGCGVIFRENETQGYLLLFSSSGQAVLYLWGDGVWIKDVVLNRFEVEDRVTTAQVILVANGPALNVFVDGVEVLNRELTGLSSGSLAFTVISNGGDDNEVSCEMRNIALWEIRP